MNVVNLIGRAGKKAETQVFDSGKKLTKFTLATSEGYGDKRETTWHNIQIWGDYGEKMANYFDKGSQIAVTGRIENQAYENKDNVKMVYSVVVVNSIELLDKRSENDVPTSEPTQQYSAPTKSSGKQTPPSAPAPQDDDLPF